jgi:hypothetical protein
VLDLEADGAGEVERGGRDAGNVETHVGELLVALSVHDESIG